MSKWTHKEALGWHDGTITPGSTELAMSSSYNVIARRHFDFPNDEQAANYVVAYAVGISCPAQIWQLRDTAAGYRPPA